MHVALPDGTQKDFRSLRSSAMTATKMTGTGVFRWRVRANFPQGRGQRPRPLVADQAVHAHARKASGTRTVGGRRSIHFAWKPKAGAQEYLVQVSERPDFSRVSDRATTDGTTYAPELERRFSTRNTTPWLYWRVAALDEDGNQSAFTKPRRPRRLGRLDGVGGATPCPHRQCPRRGGGDQTPAATLDSAAPTEQGARAAGRTAASPALCVRRRATQFTRAENVFVVATPWKVTFTVTRTSFPFAVLGICIAQ